MVKIYGLVCPISGDIRYIGKTCRKLESRLYAHITESRSKRSSHKHRWIAKCADAGLRPSIWLLEDVPAGVRWQERERAWIQKAISIGLSLTNQTAGGEGLDFIDPKAKAAYADKLSLATRKNFKDRPELREALIEGTRRSWAKNKQRRLDAIRDGWTEESKIKHRATMARVSKTPEFKKAKSEGQKKAWQRDRNLYMAAFSQPEVKAKHSARAKRCWADDETRARMMNRWTPEARAKQAAAIKERSAKIQAAMTPEVRAKQAAKLRETWAKRKQNSLK